jgi:hypothetical protein
LSSGAQQPPIKQEKNDKKQRTMKPNASLSALQRRLLLVAGLLLLSALGPLAAQTDRPHRNDLRTNGFSGKWKTSLLATPAGYTLRILPCAAWPMDQSFRRPRSDLPLSLWLAPFLILTKNKPPPPLTFGLNPVEMLELSRKINALTHKTPKQQLSINEKLDEKERTIR